MLIRPSTPSDAAEISRLAIESKARWGYDEAAMATFREELTLRPDELAPRHAHVLEDGTGQIVGFYTLASSDLSPLDLDAQSLELEHLYVRVGCLRAGFGSMLLDHAADEARALGARRLLIQSDPNAEGFYATAGAVVLERIATSVSGRTLPLMELRVA